MKKLVTILMAVAMVLALSLTAFAANTQLSISNSDGRTYEGFKLLNLTTSLKTDGHPAECDGTNHVDGCYNYSYTVNEKYADILKAQVPGDNVTDEQVLEFFEGLNNETLRPVADSIYRAIVAAGNITADEPALTGNNDEIEQGYWLFADVTNLENKEEANSLVMVDTAGQERVEINPKTDLPTIEKKVKDIADSEDAEILDNAWQDSADHDINDDVFFKLTATLPENLESFETYEIVFHDTMSAGLTLNDGMKVYMYNSKADADADVEMDSYAKDVTANFTTDAKEHADCTFEVGCDDVKAIEGVTKDTVFVVYYSAKLNENAVIGAQGNPNEVYLEFSNDAYSDSTGETKKDKVIVFTYELIINKTDAAGTALPGAGFTLYKFDAEQNQYVIVGAEVKGDAMTTFNWVGIDDGMYKLEETTVPAGYNKMADIEFTVTATHDELSDTPALTELTSTLGVADTNAGTITDSVINQTGTVLPETGAKGTLLLIGGGALLVMFAAIFMITRKKMSVYED